MQNEKAVLPSQFPMVSLLKHSLPHEEEKERERKKQKGGEERWTAGRVKRGPTQRGGKEQGSPTGQSKNKLKEPL